MLNFMLAYYPTRWAPLLTRTKTRGESRAPVRCSYVSASKSKASEGEEQRKKELKKKSKEVDQRGGRCVVPLLG